MPATAPNARLRPSVSVWESEFRIQFQSFSNLIEAVLMALWNSYIIFQIKSQVLLSFVTRTLNHALPRNFADWLKRETCNRAFIVIRIFCNIWCLICLFTHHLSWKPWGSLWSLQTFENACIYAYSDKYKSPYYIRARCLCKTHRIYWTSQYTDM